VGHGYETTDYKKLDSRLGTNETLKNFVAECHKQGIKVIFDGVFNHTGRDFFAFKDIKENRENSRYKDWYCNVNFWGNNSYNDGFSYENWGGYDLLVKLNQKNPEVINYICDVIRFWVSEFEVDGIRLDAADVLDFDFMKALRKTANEVKPEFWLMGEVIHGDYIRWANADTLHSVTNYHLHKALFSGHNDHNFFEIAHTVKRLYEMGGSRPDGLKLYNFVDNHDVERICSKLNNKDAFAPVHILLYTLPGIPSVYYGSEFGIEGKKGHGTETDAPLRPELVYDDWAKKAEDDTCVKFISALGKIRKQVKELSYGDYKELLLTNRQYAFARNYQGSTVIVMVNNDDNACTINVPANGEYTGALSGRKVNAAGNLCAEIAGNSGEIWIPATSANIEVPRVEMPKVEVEEPKIEQTPVETTKPVEETMTEIKVEVAPEVQKIVEEKMAEKKSLDLNKPYEEMSIEELQEAILGKLRNNGPLTEQMKKDVAENVYRDSLLNWVRSFQN
ncbi:MAG: alpha-amylase, partial [Lachnospiraceae bacterium]|nr:alpha-amylase [Lachnospiraceae bacterium]